jgi:ribosomal protein S18 acetylase RimI-like enzyme
MPGRRRQRAGQAAAAGRGRAAAPRQRGWAGRGRREGHGLAYATRVRSGTELQEFGKARFLAELGALIDLYAAAMRPPPHQMPGRRAIMERHAQFPSFRCVAVTLTSAAGRDPARGAADHATTAAAQEGTAAAHQGTAGSQRDGAAGTEGAIIGFAYGFHGADGQWWHDLVRRALISTGGYQFAQDWLGESFEVAEVHVHPEYQGGGIGRAMVPALLHPRLERTALLSTQDAESRARRLYRRLGFTDLVTGYRFPGTDPPYAVMGAALPLPAGQHAVRPGQPPG